MVATTTITAMRGAVLTLDGGTPANRNSAAAPASPISAPRITSGSECLPRTRRDSPITSAVSRAADIMLTRRWLSIAANPPVTTVAAAT